MSIKTEVWGRACNAWGKTAEISRRFEGFRVRPGGPFLMSLGVLGLNVRHGSIPGNCCVVPPANRKYVGKYGNM